MMHLMKPYKAHSPVLLLAFQRVMKGSLYLDAQRLAKADQQVYGGNVLLDQAFL